MVQRHVMVDIETLGLGNASVITSIGATAFTLTHGPAQWPVEPLYMRLNIKQEGRIIEPGTLEWWLNQAPAARNAWLNGDKLNIKEALEKLTIWLGNFDMRDTILWARGVNFDYAILDHAFNQLGLKTPWRYTQLADCRTFDAIVPKSVLQNTPTQGDHHNALDDCYFQAWYVVNALKHLNGTAGHDYSEGFKVMDLTPEQQEKLKQDLANAAPGQVIAIGGRDHG